MERISMADEKAIFDWMLGEGKVLNLTKCLEEVANLKECSGLHLWWYISRNKDGKNALKTDILINDVRWRDKDTLLCLVKALYNAGLDFRGGYDPIRYLIQHMENVSEIDMEWHLEAEFNNPSYKEGVRDIQYKLFINYKKKEAEIKDTDWFDLATDAYDFVKSWSGVK